MKYLIVRSEFGVETAILFDEILNHKDVAGDQAVVSAGFVQVAGTSNKWGGVIHETFCYGESGALQKVARPEDTAIVERAMVSR